MMDGQAIDTQMDTNVKPQYPATIVWQDIKKTPYLELCYTISKPFFSYSIPPTELVV